jgi:hypothetical protein
MTPRVVVRAGATVRAWRLIGLYNGTVEEKISR